MPISTLKKPVCRWISAIFGARCGVVKTPCLTHTAGTFKSLPGKQVADNFRQVKPFLKSAKEL